MPEATTSGDGDTQTASPSPSRLAKSVRTIGEVFRCSFTQNGRHKYRHIFSDIGVYWGLGFGFLSLLLATSPPFSYISLTVAGGGFLGFALLELIAVISGSVYQRGLFGFANELAYVFWGLAAVALIGLKTFVRMVTLYLPGFFIFYPPLVWTLDYVPGLFEPVAILVYIVGSVAWFRNGMMYTDDKQSAFTESPTPIPPVGVVKSAVKKLRAVL